MTNYQNLTPAEKSILTSVIDSNIEYGDDEIMESLIDSIRSEIEPTFTYDQARTIALESFKIYFNK